MARSSVSFTAQSGRLTYPVDRGLDFLDVSHLVTLVNGVAVTATVTEEPREVTLAVAAAAGATIKVQRVTPRTRLVNFLALPTGAAGLTADLLNEDARQNMLLQGEGRDVADAIPVNNGMGLNAAGQWDGTAKNVQTLAVGVDSGDAVVKSQLDTVAAGARQLPVVSGADNDDALFVTAGEFAKRTPTQSRTHLALGTAAVLNVGAAANNVGQFDASAPPLYPTADGRNIDLTNHSIQAEIAKRAKGTVVQVSRTAQAGNSLDPTLATWSQNSTSRFSFSGGGFWGARVELNNVGDLDGSFSPGRFDLSAGTWRIRWLLKVRQTSAATNFSFRLTNNDDTSGQIIYLDYGLVRVVQQYNGAHPFYVMLNDEIAFGSASAFSLVFRWAIGTTGANNDADLLILFHKVNTTVIA